MQFPLDYQSILQRLYAVDPIRYASTRNYITGAVSYLSPYISRGILTLPQIRAAVLAKGNKKEQIEKFLQELAWREYFQRVWWAKESSMFTDLKQEQQEIHHYQLPASIYNATTGIASIDDQIQSLYKTGYLHNHARMYIAGITCNLARAYWKLPSQWMYYHLLDGDLASNTCSWQWVAGSFSSKKYIANQENINRYLHSNQHHTFLDHSYNDLLQQPMPPLLQETVTPVLTTILPETDPSFYIDEEKDNCIYTSYWLNPDWKKEENANRILLLEPSHFRNFPVSEKVQQFIISIARENIPGIQIYVGEFETLKQRFLPGQKTFFLDHPLHRHFTGNADDYPWLFPQVSGYYPSFFSFWKKAEKTLCKEMN